MGRLYPCVLIFLQREINVTGIEIVASLLKHPSFPHRVGAILIRSALAKGSANSVPPTRPAGRVGWRQASGLMNREVPTQLGTFSVLLLFGQVRG